MIALHNSPTVSGMSPISWNDETVAHLYRRAAFGATADELDRAFREGLEATVDRLVNYDSVPNALLEQRIAAKKFDLNPQSRQSYIDIVRLWMFRMIYSARPFEERMTFFWHDHFATSVRKVGESDLMAWQCDLFRRGALGNFEQLCVAVAKDPAMQFWLDNFTNMKEHPNENFARELLELFTLGHGHYTEQDIMAAARAFTGWTLDRSVYPVVFMFVDAMHDHGTKTFLGQTGNWNGDDIIRIACSQFAHGQWIASKLFAYFAYDNPDQAVIDRLARVYMDSRREIRPLVQAILTSEEMYSPQAMWCRVRSPIEHVAMTCRMLELPDEVPSARDHLKRQGQLPFEPPDVSGWTGGLTWITSAALLSRMNFANEAVTTFDPATFGVPSDPGQVVDAYLHQLGPLPVDAATRDMLIEYIAPDGRLSSGNLLLSRLRGLVHLILSLPEWQLI